MITLKDAEQIIQRPEITIIRNAVDRYVKTWNVPIERTNNFFYCYYNYTPDAAEIIADGKRYLLGPEHFIIIPPNLRHNPKQLGPFRHLFLHFTASAPYTNLKETVTIPAKPYLHYIELARTPQRKDLALYTLLYNLLLEIPEEKLANAIPQDHAIEKVLEIIRRNPTTRIPLQQLAHQTNMSVSTLSHKFKKATGMSPAQYAMQFRLEIAMIQLTDNDGPGIEAIAEFCGFSNRYHFSKQFKKLYGMAPGQMKKRLLNDK